MKYPTGPLTRQEKLKYIQQQYDDLILEDSHEKLMELLEARNMDRATIVVNKDIYANEFNDEVYLNKAGIKIKDDVLDINILLVSKGLEEIQEQEFFKILNHSFDISRDMSAQEFKDVVKSTPQKKVKIK